MSCFYSDCNIAFRQGDADLYVSESMSKPTFELEEHSMSSATCGVDQVTLPKEIGRPVHVAVYGHPNYEVRITLFPKNSLYYADYFQVSSYVLDVVAVEEEEDLYDQFTLYIDEEEASNRRRKEEAKARSKNRGHRDRENYAYDEEDEMLTLSGVIWSVVKGVLHILLEILL